MPVVPDADPDATYRLTQVAHMFNIDIKTLHRKMDALGVEALPSPEDKRARVLSGAQLQTLAQRLTEGRRATADYSSDDRPRDTLSVAAEIVRARQRELDIRAAELRQQTAVIEARMDEFKQLILAMRRELPEELRGELRREMRDLLNRVRADSGQDTFPAPAGGVNGTSHASHTGIARPPARHRR